MNKSGIVISAFSGLGKTTIERKYKNICDLATSQYRYDFSNVKEEDYEKLKEDKDNKVNKNWPNNYIEALKKAIRDYDIVLVPVSLDVRKILEDNSIEYILVLPNKNKKFRDRLIKTFEERKNNKKLIDNVLTYFDNWSRDPKDYICKLEIINEDEYLEDFLIRKKYVNKGEENE